MNQTDQNQETWLPTAGKPTSQARHPGKKRKRDRPAKQCALIQAALKLFAAKGYESTTTREIAALAGCAEGLIHRYFQGKGGLLRALVDYRISKEVEDLTERLQPAATLEDEFVQLVDWEVQRMWESRDFLRVFIPRAFVDPAISTEMNRAVISTRVNALTERLEKYGCCVSLTRDQLDGLAQSVGMLGIVFGFLRPMVLGQDRRQARESAISIARLLVRGLNCLEADHIS